MKSTAALFLALAAALSAAPPRGCVAGSVPVGTFQMMVGSAAGKPRPVSQINMVKSGYRILYKPVHVPGEPNREAKVTVVLAPAEGEITGTTPLTILDLRPASAPAEWNVPVRTSVVVLVYGPAGLDEKKVTNIVTRDEDLISQIADYADQTAELETTIKNLIAMDEDPAEDLRLGDTPAEQALLALLRAQTPALSTYNPLVAGRRAPPTTLMGKVTDGFFDNAGGVIPGGGVLPGVKGFLFPDTELRSTFAQTGEEGELTLCGKKRAPRSRNKIVYLWAHRVPDMGTPAPVLDTAAHLPLGVRSRVPLKLTSASEWTGFGNARDWTLTQTGGSPQRVQVAVSDFARAIDVDLRTLKLDPGRYKLSGSWDWDRFEVAGEIHVHPLADLKAAKLAAGSQDRLVEGAGIVPVKLTGSDFQFVEGVELKASPESRGKLGNVEFTLPVGRRAGPQDTLSLEVDARNLPASTYGLSLRQAGGGVVSIPLRILPPHPTIVAERLRVNLGESKQNVTFRGVGLERVEQILSDRSEIALGTGSGGERMASVALKPGLKPGDVVKLLAKVEGVEQPVPVDAVIGVAGPRPRAGVLKSTLAEGLGVTLRQGELPAGSQAGFLLQIENAGESPAAAVQCAGGSKRVPASLERIGEGKWYLAFDPAAAGPSGCAVSAVIETDAGRSEPVPVGRVVRLPVLESLRVVEEKLVLRGQHLEVIEKVGWDVSGAAVVEGLPVPVAAEGPAQTLRIPLAQPPQSGAPLHLWLWGETEPRVSRIVLAP